MIAIKRLKWTEDMIFQGRPDCVHAEGARSLVARGLDAASSRAAAAAAAEAALRQDGIERARLSPPGPQGPARGSTGQGRGRGGGLRSGMLFFLGLVLCLDGAPMLRAPPVPALVNVCLSGPLRAVLRGEMALVGPRPCLVYMKKEFDVYGRRRTAVLPGCTGLAQTHGAIHLPWPQRWRYDAYYVEHVSLGLDFSILLRTLAVVLIGGKTHLVSFEHFLAERGGDWSLEEE